MCVRYDIRGVTYLTAICLLSAARLRRRRRLRRPNVIDVYATRALPSRLPWSSRSRVIYDARPVGGLGRQDFGRRREIVFRRRAEKKYDISPVRRQNVRLSECLETRGKAPFGFCLSALKTDTMADSIEFCGARAVFDPLAASAEDPDGYDGLFSFLFFFRPLV